MRKQSRNIHSWWIFPYFRIVLPYFLHISLWLSCLVQPRQGFGIAFAKLAGVHTGGLQVLLNQKDFGAGWWYTYPSEKYESQLGLLFPTEWKNQKCSKPPTRGGLRSGLQSKTHQPKELNVVNENGHWWIFHVAGSQPTNIAGCMDSAAFRECFPQPARLARTTSRRVPHSSGRDVWLVHRIPTGISGHQ